MPEEQQTGKKDEVIEVDVFDAIKEKTVKHKKILAYTAGIIVVAWVLLGAVPSWSPVTPNVTIVSARIAENSSDGNIVEMTVRWSAPFTKNCFLANDVRPAYAPRGIPETPEWNANHLIRYNANGGQLLPEYWINTEIIQQRENTQTFRYKLAPSNPPYFLWSELRCDDDMLAHSEAFVLTG